MKKNLIKLFALTVMSFLGLIGCNQNNQTSHNLSDSMEASLNTSFETNSNVSSEDSSSEPTITIEHNYDNLVFNEDLVNFSSSVLTQYVHNGISNAKASYTAEYTDEGIIIYFDLEDNDIYSFKDIGMSDNVEIQVLAHDTSYLSQRHTYNIICGADSRYLLRKWDKGYYSCTLSSDDFYYTFNEENNGYIGSVFFSYNALETTFDEAKGNIRVQFNMRNSSENGETVFEEFDYLGSVYELPNTWFVLNEKNEWIRKDFEKFSFGSEYDYIFNNLASISSTDGEHKNVKNGSPMFKSSNVCLNEYGIPTELLAKGSYIRGNKNGYTTTVESDGYVVVAVNDLAGDLNQYFINQGYKLIKKFGRTLTTALATNSIDFIQLVNYYAKEVYAGAKITTNEQWCVVFGARDNSLPEETWFTEPAYITKDLDHPLYDENEQVYTAAPSMAVTKNKRIFAQWHIGGAYEPLEENCSIFKYSDDLGKTWDNAFVLDSWVNKEIGGYKNNVTTDFTIGFNDKNEMLIFYILRENMNGNQTSNLSTWMMKLTNPDASPSEWNFTESKLICPNVLIKNTFRKLKDGSYIVAGQYGPDERYIHVYKSYDQGENWEFVSEVYSPQCNTYDEPIVMQRGDGSLLMTMRTRKKVMYQSVSLDNGVTWSISEKYIMPNANTRFYIGEMSNGVWYMIYNDSSTSRVKMTIAISSDEGQSWENKMCLYAASCSYPDAAIIDGKIHLVFDGGRYKSAQWRTEEDGKIKTWGHIYHYSISETNLMNTPYFTLDVNTLNIVAKCSEYTFDYIEGNGTEDDPYLIKDFASWKVISNENETNGTTFENQYFKLTDNITLNGNKKIGTSKTPFAGIFDGNGYTVTCSYDFNASTANQGVFGTIASTATIKNLKVDGTIKTVNTGASNIGSIVGVNKGGTIENCESTVDITASGYSVGGIVGVSDGGTIKDSTFKGTITSTSTKTGNTDHGIGGIVGYLSTAAPAKIEECINEGVINTGSTQVGGIVGLAKGTSSVRHAISNCENKANITSTASVNSTTNEGTAGIVGMLVYSDVTDCINNGDITALKSCQVAGIAGKCCDSSVVTNSVNNGTIVGIAQVGGIAGRNAITVDGCTNNGDILCTSSATTVGQIYGFNNKATISNCIENGSCGRYEE